MTTPAQLEQQVGDVSQDDHHPSSVGTASSTPDQQASWVPGVRFTAHVGTPVLFDFGDDGRGGTRIVLLHRPLRSDPAVGYCAGWHVMLDALDTHLDGRDPNAVPPDFAGLYELYAADASTG